MATPQISEESLAKVKAYLRDDILWFKECATVRDHNTSQLLPFKLRRGQQILHNVAQKQMDEQGYVRIFLYKSRRFGGSTYVETRLYKRTSMEWNRNAFIVGHEESSTATLFNMAKLCHEKNPIAPATRASNAQELIFDNKQGTGLKSQYKLATAKNVDAGRSQGIHYLHLSEEAFYPDNAPALITGLFNCFPEPPTGTEIWRESTANGCGNTFHKGVMDTYCEGKHVFYEEDGIPFAWHNPKRDWVVVFIPWFVDTNLTKPFDRKEDKEAFEKAIHEKRFDQDSMSWVEKEELRLKKRFKLTLEQLHWREWAIENKCNGDINLFHQDYPATVEEGFLSQGTNVFSRTLCDDLQAQCAEPVMVCDPYRLGGLVRTKRNRHGKFTVWEEYKDCDTYFLTVDVAGGIKDALIGKKRSKDEEPDRTNIDVWNHRTGMQVAQWNGHMDYDLVADMVQMIGELYAVKTAKEVKLPTACVELNNHGFTVVRDLKNMNYPQYGNSGTEPGWQTNRRTKPQMIDGLKEAARDGSLKINSVQTVSEMRTYIEEGGKFAAASGCKDDRVITAAMASELVKVLPRTYGRTRSAAIEGARLTGDYDYENEPSRSYAEFYA